MTQVTFSAATTPQLTDLDANFTELYNKTINNAYKSVQAIDIAPTVFGVTLGKQGGASAGFRHYMGLNLSHDGSNWRTGTDGSNNGAGGVTCTVAGVMEFFTISNTGGTSQTIANGSMVTRMTIDTSGNVLVGTTTAPTGVAGDPIGTAQTASGVGLFTRSSSNAALFVNNKQAGSVTLVQFYSGGATVGSISSNGTNTAYNTSSDYRLKDAVAPISGSGAFIDALNPVRFTWKSDGAAGAGFLAHELQAVSPSSVHGAKDAVQDIGDLKDAEGSVVATGIPQPDTLGDGQTWTKTGVAPVFQAVEYGSAEVIAMLVAEVKDLRRRVAALNG